MAQQLYDTVGELNHLRNHTSPKPTKLTQIRDSFVNITGGGNGSGESVDQIYSNYLVQNLVPNTTYSLKFKIGRPDGSGGYTDELGEGNYLIPSAVNGLLDNSLISDGSTSPGHFYWSSGSLAERQLLFITDADDGSNITGSNFNDARQTYNYNPGEISEGTQLYNVPPSSAKYSGFITDAKAYALDSTGVPQGSSGGFSDDSITPSSDQFDAYLFLFEKGTTQPADLNAHLTGQVFTNTPGYIGNAGVTHYTDSNKGFKRYANINTTAAAGVSNQTIDIQPSDFGTDGVFGSYNGGQGLIITQEYRAGLMLVNRTSGYIVKTDTTAGGRTVKWYTNVIPTGGVWSISLGEFLYGSSLGSVSNATSVAVKVDSIGVQGAVPTGTFQLQIFAAPYEP